MKLAIFQQQSKWRSLIRITCHSEICEKIAKEEWWRNTNPIDPNLRWILWGCLLLQRPRMKYLNQTISFRIQFCKIKSILNTSMDSSSSICESGCSYSMIETWEDEIENKVRVLQISANRFKFVFKNEVYYKKKRKWTK